VDRLDRDVLGLSGLTSVIWLEGINDFGAENRNRRALVYTPPSYDRSHAPLHVLYLYHGFWDTCYSWVTEGRLAQILDNLLAEGKAVPMIVVVSEAHALPPEDVPGMFVWRPALYSFLQQIFKTQRER
jgi:enterochelin esterase-like enzyme